MGINGSLGVSGHGVTIAMEQATATGSWPNQVYTLTAGVFVVVAEVTGDVKWPVVSRSKTDITPHSDSSDSYAWSYMMRAALGFDVNFIQGDTSQNWTTGLQGAI